MVRVKNNPRQLRRFYNLRQGSDLVDAATSGNQENSENVKLLFSLPEDTMRLPEDLREKFEILTESYTNALRTIIEQEEKISMLENQNKEHVKKLKKWVSLFQNKRALLRICKKLLGDRSLWT